MGKINDYKKVKDILYYISKVFSWACFAILFLVASFLVYYFVESKIYAARGEKHQPRFSLFTIISASMVPNINVYDVVFDQKVSDYSKIKAGDVITFVSDNPAHKGIIITHRVSEVGKNDQGYYFHTKGDNNDREDSTVVTQDRVIGKVMMRFPQLGRIQMIVSTRLGWILCILLPALSVIIYDAIKVSKTIKLNKTAEIVAEQKKKEEKANIAELKARLMAKHKTNFTYASDTNDLPRLK